MNESNPASPQGKSSRRAVLIAGGGVALVALLGGAAYVASRLTAPSGPQGDAGMIVSQGGSMGQPVQRTFNLPKMPKIKPAPEIPVSPPDVRGIFRRRDDNSLFIGTGNVTIAYQSEQAGSGEMSAKTDGPEVEVVVTRKTQLFKDTTPISMEAMESGKELQQRVEPVASLDALVESLGKADGLSIWGARNGDRFIAETILYHPPVMLSSPSR